ncbi:MAG TPA: trypsin-like serine protease, partial [Pyrinomonadaceae bacterium]
MIEKLTAKIYRQNKKEEWGTAWLCSAKYALTAAHCVGNRETKQVSDGPYTLKFDWGELEAEVLKADFFIDAALLKITGGDEIKEGVKVALSALPSEDPWPVGPKALGWRSFGFALANPAGLFISGIIDAPEGRIEENGVVQKAIQMTCEQGGYDYLQGMSGAAVRYENNVVGLVRWAPPPLRQKVIYAVPLARIQEAFPEVEKIINTNLNSKIEEFRESAAAGDGGAADKRLVASEGPVLYGREDEVAEIKKALREDGVRLLTLAGGIGTGKTALARRVGCELADGYKSGAYFVDLSLVRDPGRVPAEIADTLGVKESQGGSLMESLTVYLKDKPALLILDGFEDLGGAEPYIKELYDKCPRLQFVITYREELGWEDEQVYRIRPLGVPDNAGAESLESLPAVRLFLDRLRGNSPEFKPDAEGLRVIAEICKRLGGLPLAIELAAAQSGGEDSGPAEVLAQVGGIDAATPEERLAKVVEMSYGMLEEEARALLRRLSVFKGGATPEAVESLA